MSRLTTKGNAAIWIIAIHHFLLIAGNAFSQSNGPGLIGKTFFAINVSNADSAAVWYEELLGVKLLKEIRMPDGFGHIRIEGSEFLMVEILRAKDSRSLTHCNLERNQSHLLRGYFKTGLFVEDIHKAREYFKSKGVDVRHDVFSDKETATVSFILEDPDGNMLQFIQDDKRTK